MTPRDGLAPGVDWLLGWAGSWNGLAPRPAWLLGWADPWDCLAPGMDWLLGWARPSGGLAPAMGWLLGLAGSWEIEEGGGKLWLVKHAGVALWGGANPFGQEQGGGWEIVAGEACAGGVNPLRTPK